MMDSITEKRIEVLEKALEFYANKTHYIRKHNGHGMSTDGKVFDLYDDSQITPAKAIEALKTSRYLKGDV